MWILAACSGIPVNAFSVLSQNLCDFRVYACAGCL